MSHLLATGWRYRALTQLISPLLVGHATWKTIQLRNSQFLLERLGFAPTFDTPVNWWHAASVGEIQTIWPLLHAVICASDNSDERWLVTTNTTTGRDVLEQRIKQAQLTDRVQHAFFPIDTPGISKRFIKRIDPTQLCSVETEIWPNTYTTLQNLCIPISIVNARVTKKTLNSIKANSKFSNTLKPAYKNALTNVKVQARSQDDALGYLQLGALERNIQILGDLKFVDNRPPNCKPPLSADTLTEPYVIAASTHPTEESALCEHWMQQSESGLLVLVPRHVERGAALHSELLKNYGQALAPLRSMGGEPNTSHRLYIADTIGELHDWYSGAATAFVGGSLIDRGGHNVLEPYFHGVPVVTGPHTDNFVDAVDWLTKQQTIHLVSNAKEAVSQLIRLSQSGMNTSAIKTNNVLDRYLECLT